MSAPLLASSGEGRTVVAEELRLDHNERLRPALELVRALARTPASALTRYPGAEGLEADLAARWDIDPERVLVTAGGDDGIDRICRRFLRERPEMLTVTPTFEMIPLCTRLAQGTVVGVPTLEDPAPLEPLLARLGERTGVVAIVTPHNPTGLVASTERLLAISEALPAGAVLMADLAYSEFADDDPTRALLECHNVLVVRTLSKAWGLAGLRVGYVLGAVDAVRELRGSGPPFPLSGPSIWVARRALQLGERVTAEHVAAVRREREALAAALGELGATSFPSQANFVLARAADAAGVRERLLARGVRVRCFADLPDMIRITLPGDPEAFARLSAALGPAFRKEDA